MTLIKNLSAKNRGIRRGRVEFIVLHDTAGSGTKNDAEYLAHDPEHRGISVDFCITKDGTVYQLNNDLSGHCTYHAGRHTRFRDYVNGGVNQHSVGIEIAQKADMRNLDPQYPLIQVDAVAQTCVDLCKRFGLSKQDITTHKQIITDGSRSDPRLFPWDLFWTAFDGVSNAAGEPIGPIRHMVITGDTLFAIANKYHTTIEAIKSLNGINVASNVIETGQVLIVKR
jgi:N-acetyl-anhydromuramyl-L-alanine amidase AmpD